MRPLRLLSAGALQRITILGALVVIVGVFSLLSDVFLTPANIRNIVLQSSVIGVLAVGMTMVILIAGIDLSVGSAVAFCGMLTALLQHLPAPVAALAGVAAGTAGGLVIGLLITGFSLPPFIATLGFMALYRGLTLIISGGQSVSITTSLLRLGGFMPIVYFLGSALVVWAVLGKTRFGRYQYAIGGNEDAARLSGIRVDRVKVGVFTIMGALAGVAGVALAARQAAGDPNAGVMYELDAIASVVIGGTSLMGGYGGVGGTIVGVLIIGTLTNGLQLLNVPDEWQQVAKGLIIIAAVVMDTLMRRRAGRQ